MSDIEKKKQSRRYKVVIFAKYTTIAMILHFMVMLFMKPSAVKEVSEIYLMVIGSLLAIITTWMGFESHNKKYFKKEIKSELPQ